MCSLGGCALDKAYTGPKLDVDDEGVYQITATFVKEMIEWFKLGKALPKRYVWEICLRVSLFRSFFESLKLMLF
jgi:serine/threonine-protein phosphatase 5